MEKSGRFKVIVLHGELSKVLTQNCSELFRAPIIGSFWETPLSQCCPWWAMWCLSIVYILSSQGLLQSVMLYLHEDSPSDKITLKSQTLSLRSNQQPQREMSWWWIRGLYCCIDLKHWFSLWTFVLETVSQFLFVCFYMSSIVCLSSVSTSYIYTQILDLSL